METEGKITLVAESVTKRCSLKKVFLEILQNSQENTCARVSCSFRPTTLVKERVWHRNFSEHLFFSTRPVAASKHWWENSKPHIFVSQ